MNDTILTTGTDSSRRSSPIVTRVIPCPGCGAARTIRARHEWFFARAAQRTCTGCSVRALHRWNADNMPADGPTVEPARQYIPDHDVIDWVLVDRLCSGQVKDGWRDATKAERMAAVAKLTARRMNAAQIADRIGVTQRTVVRLRAAIRTAVAAEQATNETEAA